MILIILMKNKLNNEVNLYIENNFENVFFEGSILKKYFLKNQPFQKLILGTYFWMYQVGLNWVCLGKGGK